MHEFIFKIYKSNDSLAERCYQNEVHAFQTLAFNEDAGKYIVKFYGSFVQQDISVINLEYADKGTLEQYYLNENPKLESDITDFWSRLFDLARGLAQIHDVDLKSGDHQSTFYG